MTTDDGPPELAGLIDWPTDPGTWTDAADADSGSFNGTGISVGLGTVAAGTTRTVTFKVKID